MTLNCSGVRLDNRKVFCTPGPLTKPFERFFCRSINNDAMQTERFVQSAVVIRGEVTPMQK